MFHGFVGVSVTGTRHPSCDDAVTVGRSRTQVRAVHARLQVPRHVSDGFRDEHVIAGEVLRELKRIALLDPRAFLTRRNLNPVLAWTPEMAAAVSSIEVLGKKVAGGRHIDVIHKIRFSPKT